jgi:hypothetical protein
MATPFLICAIVNGAATLSILKSGFAADFVDI